MASSDTDAATWYEAWFDSALYELVYGGRNLEEAERLAELIEHTAEPAAGARILDVGTGRGRHARVLARRGYHVTGVDLSSTAVETAHLRADAEGLKVTFHVGDMRSLVTDSVVMPGSFDGVVNLFTSFGYFETRAEHAQAVAEMAAALRPGGWLVQDFLCADYVRSHLVASDEQTVRGVRVRQERWIEENAPGGARVRKRITLAPSPGPEAPDGLTDQLTEPKVFIESVRLLTLDDFRAFYDAAGLVLTHTFGDYAGAPVSSKAPRLILIARRAA